MVKVGLSQSEVVKPNFFAGPYAGINLNQSSGGLLGSGRNEKTSLFAIVAGISLPVKN